MIVSCSTCTTKFNVPDAKVAGKRARMTCKKCGATISIDGTTLSARAGSATGSRPKNEPQAPSPGGLSPRWRVAEPSGKRHELSLDSLAQRYSSGGLEPGTLVCRPGENRWMPPYDFPEVMVKASPIEDGLASQPTFSDETVALSSAESAALSRQAQPSYSNLESELAREASQGKAGLPREKFFDGTDVQGAMDSFDRLTDGAPPPSSIQRPAAEKTGPPPIPPGGSLPPPPPVRSSAPPAPNSSRVPPRRRSTKSGIAPPPRTWSSAPSRPSTPPVAPSAPPPPPRAPALSTMPAPRGSAPPPPIPPGAFSGSSSVTSASAVSRPPPGPPAMTSGASAVATQPSASSAPPMPQYAAYGEVSSTRVFDTRPTATGPSLHAVAPRPRPSAPPLASGFPSHPPPGLSSPTTQSGLSRIERRPGGPSGLFIVFLTLVLLVGAVAGLYLFRPDLYERGLAATSTLLGRARSPSDLRVAKGPPFDEAQAGVVLGKAASSVHECRRTGGPSGKGRVRVLYQPDGRAQKVVVSSPFHGTSVGSCLVDHFKETRVPAFGGQPVIVNKTFDLGS